MKVITKQLVVNTKAGTDIIDITSGVVNAISKAKLKSGTVTIFVPGATGAISTVEYEPGLLKDIPRALEKIAPSDAAYEHHKTWGCDNGNSHVRATLLGPSMTVPFVNGKLTLGTWQQIILLDFDTSARNRNIILQIIGE